MTNVPSQRSLTIREKIKTCLISINLHFDFTVIKTRVQIFFNQLRTLYTLFLVKTNECTHLKMFV